MPKIGSPLRGIYRDLLKDPNRNIIFDSGWNANLIVDRCRILLAAFMKYDQTPATMGIRCLKVGRGDPAWDNGGIEAPHARLEALVDPEPFTIDAAHLDMVYLDERNDEVNQPTSRLQITAALGIDQPAPPGSSLTTYPLREFGLFGKYGNEDYMIDCIRHPVIHKDITTTLIRVVRLYF